MFGWFYRRIAGGIIRNTDISDLFLKITTDETCQKQIVAMTDQLYERYKLKVLGTIGGMQKGLNFSQGEQLPNIIDSKGHVSLKNIIPLILPRLLGNQGQNQGQTSSIPKELMM